MAYLHPGVYVEEIPSGSKPIEGVATSVAAFVGTARRGPIGEAELVQSFDDYTKLYGDIASEDDAMGFSVRSFYLNGGKSAFICRLSGEGTTTAAAEIKGIGNVTTQTTKPVLKISASSGGKWGNELFFQIVNPDHDLLTFDLLIGHKEKGKDDFIVDEAFNDLSMRVGDSAFAPNLVNDTSRLVRLEAVGAADVGDSGEKYQPAVLSGGALATDVDFFKTNITDPMTLSIDINALGGRTITLSAASFDPVLAGTDHAVDGGRVASEIQKAVQALDTAPAYAAFTCTYSADHFVLTSIEPTLKKDKPLASLQVTASELSRRLRLDGNQKAQLKGNGTPSGFGGATHFKTKLLAPTPVDKTLVVNIDNHGAETIKIAVAESDLPGVSNQADGDKVAEAIQNAVRGLNSGIESYKDFRCTYTGLPAAERGFILTSGSGNSRASQVQVTGGTLRTDLGLNSTTTALNRSGRSLNQGTAQVIPVQTLGSLNRGEKLAGGSEQDASADDFTRFYNNVLRKVRDVSILLVPGESWAADGSGNPKISATLAHCNKVKSRVVIIDPPPGHELDQAATVNKLSLPSSTYSALYYPWVKVRNPFYHAEKNPAADRMVQVPPSSFAAGMWSRIDARRGVWKAPAGMGAGLVGAAGLEYIVEDGEQDQLNPLGVNCFRNMPGGGRVIWGSRTLATKADPEWRYVPVRRTAIMIEQSIFEGIQWAVFEPNDHRLWAALRGNIGGFMNGLFRVNAFQGEKASDAYFVRCGLGDTMTQAEIDAGQVIVIVGFAPLKPAEFVIVRVQQKVNQQ